ncbi:MAG: Fic family protein [Parcubacteria group bacterium]|jgi:Fic family protein
MKRKIGETSYKQTAFGIIPRSKLILLEIEGTKRAWDFILHQGSKRKIPITVEFIKKLHNVGFGWIFPKFGGNFRKINVQVSNHKPPQFYLIDQLMANFTKDLEARLKYLPKIEKYNFLPELISLLSWSHHRFLWIHPFADYNGRIARLLTNIILLNLNLPPIELKIETKAGRLKYINALHLADQGNCVKLEKIIREAIEESAKELN